MKDFGQKLFMVLFGFAVAAGILGLIEIGNLQDRVAKLEQQVFSSQPK